MPTTERKLPETRLRVTLDDAIYISADRIYVDLKTNQGPLRLWFDDETLAAVLGEVAASLRPGRVRLRTSQGGRR